MQQLEAAGRPVDMNDLLLPQPVKEASQQIKIQHVKSDMPGIYFGFFIEILKQQPERTFVR